MEFNLRYWAELRSKFKGVFWRVEIAERGYAGSSEEMAFDGNNPLQITWEKRGDEFFAPIKGSEATINILCRDNFHYLNLFTSDPRKFRVSVFRNTKLYWRGYVVADLYSENFTAPPYAVSIKAVDGFNLLSSIPFLNAEGLNEDMSPLCQVYVDIGRFYAVYSKPTFRDVLELCLRPFAGQIFQSNGALHIRRTISLYNDTRPLSFYSVGSEFPSGWLVTADGHNLVTSTGEPIVTQATRDRIDSIWDNDINVQGESVMDIVPALRKVTVTVKNKMLQNIIPQMGIFDINLWSDPNQFLTLREGNYLNFEGDSQRQGSCIQHSGYGIQRCTYKFTLECTIKSFYNKWTVMSSGTPTSVDHEVKVEYGFRIDGSESKNFWLQDDGRWSQSYTAIIDMVKTSTPTQKKIEIQGMPTSGRLVMYIVQTLQEQATGRNGIFESVQFQNLALTMDTGDDYDNSLKYELALNRANNVDMEIPLPIADVPNIPNDRLIYALYFTINDGTPTRMWHTKAGNDYNPLINHLIACALRYKQLPSRRITGEMFAGKHIDMNTVVQDDKYLHAGFYVNSTELNCLNDTYNSELVEMPRLLRKETPAPDDDCIKMFEVSSPILECLKCENQIILRTATKIFRFDTASHTLEEVAICNSSTRISPADNAFVIMQNNLITVVDYRGVVIKSHTIGSQISVLATYMGGYIYQILKNVGRTVYYYLNRPEYKYTYTSYRRGYGYDYTAMYGDVKNLLKSFSAIAINTTQRAYLHDRRTNTDLLLESLEDGSEIKSLSDYFICMNVGDTFKIYRRDTVTERTLIKTIAAPVDFADHTLSEVAYTQAGETTIWTCRTNTTRNIINRDASNSAIKGLFYINGELYIVREFQTFKHIP